MIRLKVGQGVSKLTCRQSVVSGKGPVCGYTLQSLTHRMVPVRLPSSAADGYHSSCRSPDVAVHS